jgi:TIR domain-containing protein
MAKRISKPHSNIDESLQSPQPTPIKSDVPFRPLVFVSHDSRDAELAEAFSNLLTDASGGVLKSFRSSDRKGTAGIEFGAEWYNAIMGKLDDATDVVALLTANSIDRPWILYEAGVAKGKLNKQVFGVVVGIPLEQASRGPFAQFQNCGDDEDSLTKLVLQLIRRNSDAEPREEAVRRQVNAFRENVKSLVDSAASEIVGKPEDPNTVSKLFEEIKVVLGDLPDKLNLQLTETLRSRGVRRRHRLHPMIFEDLMHLSLLGRNPRERAAAWLMFVTLLRDDLPWIYELGMEAYRVMKRERPQETRAALERFADSVETSFFHPILGETIDKSEVEAFRMVRHIPAMIRDFMPERFGEEEALPTKKDRQKAKQP